MLLPFQALERQHDSTIRTHAWSVGCRGQGNCAQGQAVAAGGSVRKGASLAQMRNRVSPLFLGHPDQLAHRLHGNALVGHTRSYMHASLGAMHGLAALARTAIGPTSPTWELQVMHCDANPLHKTCMSTTWTIPIAIPDNKIRAY